MKRNWPIIGRVVVLCHPTAAPTPEGLLRREISVAPYRKAVRSLGLTACGRFASSVSPARASDRREPSPKEHSGASEKLRQFTYGVDSSVPRYETSAFCFSEGPDPGVGGRLDGIVGLPCGHRINSNRHITNSVGFFFHSVSASIMFSEKAILIPQNKVEYGKREGYIQCVHSIHGRP